MFPLRDTPSVEHGLMLPDFFQHGKRLRDDLMETGCILVQQEQTRSETRQTYGWHKNGTGRSVRAAARAGGCI